MNAVISKAALCKGCIENMGLDPNSPVIPQQFRTICETPGCESTGKYLVEVGE